MSDITRSVKMAMNSFDNTINKFGDEYIRKPEIVYGILVLFIILYSAQIAPMLPGNMTHVFGTSFFKLFVFVMIMWIAHVSPSLSIIIAVVFLMSTNYLNNKKLWEFLDNTTPVPTTVPTTVPTPVDSVNAINNLTVQAMTPAAGTTAAVNTAVTVATSNISPTDTPALTAVAQLGQQALSPAAGNLPTVQQAMTTAVQGVNNNLSATVTPATAIQALQVLANAASTPLPVSNTVIMTAANTAMTAMTAMPSTSAPAIQAVQALASQSVTPSPNVDQNTIAQLTKIAVNGITSAPNSVPTDNLLTVTPAPKKHAHEHAHADSGCYPARHIDMSKVNASIDNASIEDYQTFTTSK